MYGLKHAGIGRYVQNLVMEILKQDKKNNYVLFVRKDFEEKEIPDFNNIELVVTDYPHYSLNEQLLFSWKIYQKKLDLVHFPNFNLPVFYFGKYILTIHDLIKHTSKGVQTTTRSPWLYWLKYLGYKIVFWSAVKRAYKILVPSQTVKNELVKEYRLNPKKVVVTYEGVEQKKQSEIIDSDILKKYKITKPFLLYVGSVYPHKNIERLIEAVKILKINLVVSCSRSIFWERLKEKINKMGAEEYVNLAGFVPDEELSVLYRSAEAFVFPTLSEGFGLPGLEAMAQGCPVVCSNIPVLREVYGEAAEYFNPNDPKDIAEEISRVINDKNKEEQLREKGYLQAKKYSWEKMASETLLVYNPAIQ